MDVHVEDRQSDLPLSVQAIKAIVSTVLAFEGHHCDEVSIYIVSTQEICELHEQVFDDPSPTDCISFPMDGIDGNDILGSPCVLGEVVVCPKTAIEYAEAHRGDPYQEVTLYIVHGLLHLLGYDDIASHDRIVMRAAEQRHMTHLRELNLLLRNE